MSSIKNNMEAGKEADGTSYYESTSGLLERRSSILFVQKYDFSIDVFIICIHFLYRSKYLFNADICLKVI
jgi:hypothetical protein